MTDAEPPRPSEPVEPYPRRYWWLTRLAALWVVVVAAVVGVRVWWGDVAAGRLAATIDAAHARGEKILVADFARPYRLPDERNAAFYLRRAETSLKLSRTEEWALDSGDTLPLREDVYQTLGAALGRIGPALADIRRARELDETDWGVNIASPMWSVLLPHLNKSRRLANVSRAAAFHAAQSGDHAAAIEHVRDMQRMARTLDDGNVFLVTHLVQLGVDAITADAAAQLATDLQVAGATDASTRPAHAPATREQVRALIANLLDDGPRRASLHASLQGERAAQVDIGMTVAKRARLVQPAIELDVVGLTEEGEQVMAAAAAPSVAGSNALVPNPPRIDGPRVAAHVVSESIRPALGRALTTSLRAATQTRLAALGLAIRLYQLDHGGQRPPTLDALVPDYVPALPADPFAANGEPLRYVADPTAPYVYSVGENGDDDSGVAPFWRPDATTIDPFKAPDLFLPLTRGNAPPPTIDDMPEPESEPASTPSTTDTPPPQPIP
jgi:hypothetical protein